MKSQDFLHIWRQGVEELGEAVEIRAGKEGTCDACRDEVWRDRRPDFGQIVIHALLQIGSLCKRHWIDRYTNTSEVIQEKIKEEWFLWIAKTLRNTKLRFLNLTFPSFNEHAQQGKDIQEKKEWKVRTLLEEQKRIVRREEKKRGMHPQTPPFILEVFNIPKNCRLDDLLLDLQQDKHLLPDGIWTSPGKEVHSIFIGEPFWL